MPAIVIRRVRSAPTGDDWRQYREIADRNGVVVIIVIGDERLDEVRLTEYTRYAKGAYLYNRH